MTLDGLFCSSKVDLQDYHCSTSVSRLNIYLERRISDIGAIHEVIPVYSIPIRRRM